MLLLFAAVLAAVSGTPQLSWAILAVVVLNALFAFFQEHQADRAVEALGHYLPPHARVRRDRSPRDVPAAEIVPGDVLLLAEGDRVPADARLISGALEIDASALTAVSTVPASTARDSGTSSGTTVTAPAGTTYAVWCGYRQKTVRPRSSAGPSSTAPTLR